MSKRKATTSAAATASTSAMKKSSSSTFVASVGAKAKAAGKKARFEGPAPTSKSSASSSKPSSKKSAAAAVGGSSKEKKAPRTVPTPAAPSTFVVSAGSYERLLYGLSCSFVADASSKSDTSLPVLKVEPIFSFPAHLSSIKSVASSVLASPGTGSERKVGGKYLVSGGTDEVIKVWDLKRKKEVGSLEGEANGTITCLRFVAQRNMLLAASTESVISMYRVRDWVLLRSLKAHKGRVNSVDAHPDGRVALSVGQDKMLRMWDLVAGKAVATMKLSEEGDLVRWNTDGTKFAVICASTLTIYGIDMSVHHTFTAASRFHDLRFCYFPIDASDPTQCEYLFVACEDGKTRVFDITTSASTAKVVSDEDDEEEDEEETPSIEPVAVLSGHANRVKMMDLLEVALDSTLTSTTTTASTTIVLTTVSSDGKINLYDLAKLKLARSTATIDPISARLEIVEVTPSASFDTDKSRLTCVCVIGVPEKKESKDGEVLEDVDEDEDDDSGEDDSEDDEDSEGSFQGIASDDDDNEEDEDEEEGEMEDGEDEEEEE